MKRFYKMVSRSGDAQNGFFIELDGKPVRSPSGELMTTTSMALADAIAAEWQAQEEDINTDTMPLTQFLTTASGKADQRYEVAQTALAYLDTDLLCYHTNHPAELAERQKQGWGRWLEWFEKRFGHKLETTCELKALKQPGPAHEAIAELVESYDECRFCVLEIVTALSGSLIMAIAFVEGEAGPDDVFSVAQLEESYKAEIYNEDVHGAAPMQEKSQEDMRRTLKAARRFLELLAE